MESDSRPASADQRVKIWRKDEQGKWIEEADWRAHDAPVTRLAWSHPEHGDLLASCSFDRSVKVWQESADARHGAGGASGGSASGSGATRWQEKAFLSEAKGSVRAVEFAPNHFGLKLASISTDAHLRLYASLSPTANDWQLAASVHLPALALPETADDPARGSVGGGAGGGAAAGTSSSSSSALGTPASALAGGSSSTLQSSGGAFGSAALGGSAAGLGKNNEALGGWDLSFCKEHWWGMLVAAACGSSGVVTVIDLAAESPVAVLALNPAQSPVVQAGNTSSQSSNAQNTSSSSAGPAAPITTVAWAPSCGRSYHLVATGSVDGTVRIWRVTPPDAAAGAGGDDDAAAMEESRAWAAEIRGEWGRGDAGVAKVEWNITGTVLSVATEDGRIRLYKMSYAGSWDCMGTFSAEAPAEGSDAGDDQMQRE